MNAHSKAIHIATEIGKPDRASFIERQLLAKSFAANRAAIDAATLSQGVALSGIAGPAGCDLCGNTVEVRGYDCWACESAYNAPVSDTTALAVKLAALLSGVRDWGLGK